MNIDDVGKGEGI